MSSWVPGQASNVTPTSGEVVTSAQDSTDTPYGPIGKWMVDADGQPAHWLDYQLGDRALREPINVVLIDRLARTPQEALSRLLSATKAAGYPARTGHSTGYQGLIGAQLYAQQPGGSGEAFSDDAWWRSNNHGRLFGPAPLDGGGFVWTGALSREDFEVISVMHHPYASFKAARDDFGDRMSAAGNFKRLGTLDLGNALNTPSLTTDDHDGKAVVLMAAK
ncbi:hypothetical protein DKM44_01115 [Deinococcus irradiatisoli]|uniref:Uncharacterized protein n=1 Tax=Deinococcus irradiatisoli TaxID=2202254 RepID=A0A2Z3JD86_9DEIO|nr:hypothetical protein DKM44_01115 [Deinococcus irradiatisoli]